MAHTAQRFGGAGRPRAAAALGARARELAAAAVALALTTAPAAHAKPGKVILPTAAKARAFPFSYEVVTLPNGLRAVLVRFESPGLVAFQTMVRVGSRNEPEPGKSGFAHFFEHMMFRGTEAHPAQEYAQTVQRLGLDSNAFTSDDLTVYHLYGPAAALPTIIEYEGDRFRNLAYDEQQFRTEAGAILGEYAKSASDPELKLEEALVATAFQKHTYRHTTIGFLEDIKAMPEGFAYSRQFFDRYYRPDNAVVFIAGDFDRARTVALLRQHFGPWKGKAHPVAVPAEPLQRESRRASVDWPRPTLARLVLAWHAPAAAELKAAAVQLVLAAYLAGETSPLYQELVVDKQLAEQVFAAGSAQRDPGLFQIAARVREGKPVAEVEAAILARVAELRAGLVDAQRLEAVRANLKYGTILRLETARAVAGALARMTAPTGDVKYLEKLYAQVDALRPQDLAAFAKKWLVDSNRTTVTLASADAAAGGEK